MENDCKYTYLHLKPQIEILILAISKG